MPTKKQLRAQQKRRHQQFEAKLAARRTKRRYRQRVTGAVMAGALVLGGGTFAVLSMSSPPDSGSSSSSAEPSPSPEPSASTPAVGFPTEYAEDREWDVVLDTNQGVVTLTLDGFAAPMAVSSFAYLADQGYFDGTECYRLTTEGIYVLQCGDPTATGTGGPGYSFGPVENAPSDNIYPAGTVAMARRGGDGYSMGSQFFIVYEDSFISSDAAGGYTVFGTVTDGMGIVEAIAEAGTETGSSDGPPATPVILNEVTAT